VSKEKKKIKLKYTDSTNLPSAPLAFLEIAILKEPFLKIIKENQIIIFFDSKQLFFF
jgi:hypothetical protein